MGKYESKISNNASISPKEPGCPCKGTCSGLCKGSCKFTCGTGCQAVCYISNYKLLSVDYEDSVNSR